MLGTHLFPPTVDSLGSEQWTFIQIRLLKKCCLTCYVTCTFKLRCFTEMSVDSHAVVRNTFLIVNTFVKLQHNIIARILTLIQPVHLIQIIHILSVLACVWQFYPMYSFVCPPPQSRTEHKDPSYCPLVTIPTHPPSWTLATTHMFISQILLFQNCYVNGIMCM